MSPAQLAWTIVTILLGLLNCVAFICLLAIVYRKRKQSRVAKSPLIFTLPYRDDRDTEEFQVDNSDSTKRLGFQVVCSDTEMFSVSPASGIIEPGGTQLIRVSLTAPPDIQTRPTVTVRKVFANSLAELHFATESSAKRRGSEVKTTVVPIQFDLEANSSQM